MSNGDFYTGYAAGQGAGANSVDVQGHYNNGFRDGVNKGLITGADDEHINQSWYVQRLMRHLKARNSQKQASMQALRKYAPNHPYLNETIVPNATSMMLDNTKKDNTYYPRVANNCNIDEMSNLLVAKMGGGITTEGDLAMKADGLAIVSLEDNLPEGEEAALLKTFNDLDAEPSIRAQRLAEIKAAEVARVESNIQAAKAKEKAERLNDPMKLAPNFMTKIFG